MQTIEEPTLDGLLACVSRDHTPTWLPWPMPSGWAVSGIGRTDIATSLIAFSGPDLVGGVADLFIVSEEPGGHLGAACAGIASTDAGFGMGARPADVRIEADHHRAPLWRLPCPPDRDVLLGEAAGRWLWLVTFPDSASLMISDDFRLVGVHELVAELELVPLTGRTGRFD